MPVEAALNGAIPARRNATAAVRMSPPPISTGFHSFGGTLFASILGWPTGHLIMTYPKCATDVSLAS
jgi:hypothetical protein